MWPPTMGMGHVCACACACCTERCSAHERAGEGWQAGAQSTRGDGEHEISARIARAFFDYCLLSCGNNMYIHGHGHVHVAEYSQSHVRFTTSSDPTQYTITLLQVPTHGTAGHVGTPTRTRRVYACVRVLTQSMTQRCI